MARKNSQKKKCFVIMPIGKSTPEHTEHYWTENFMVFLKPLIEANPELRAHRARALRGDILREIITDLVVSPVVVADLTDHNPNVFWELGVRQSFRHSTVTIAEQATKLPFDVGGKGTLFYAPNDHLRMEEFRIDFKEAINDCLANPDRPDSHVLETLSGRGTLFEIFRRDEAVRRLQALTRECTRNLSVLKSAVGRAEKNQANAESREYTTFRFRVSALELLVINCYIEETPTFFELAEECLNRATMLNDQLNLWEQNPGPTEKWLIGQEENARENLESFRARVQTNLKMLRRQF